MCPNLESGFVYVDSQRIERASGVVPATLRNIRPFVAKPTPRKIGFLRAVERASRQRATARMKVALETMWMAFQPIVNTSRRRVFAYEALMRNEEPSLPFPGDVIGAAERLGYLQALGRRARTLSAEAFTHAPADTLLFVNLHPRDLLDPALYDERAPLTRIANRVVLEITERPSLDCVGDLQARLSALRCYGFRIAIDDLGSGYAGLSACVSLEPEFVKLDMFLVRNVHESEVRQRLIETLMALRAGMHMKIIAEGVELEGERDRLQNFDCSLMQGYLFAKPGPPFPRVDLFR
jgi:EAL domain-containing protein (putative c-di-GMP-specific phosphodiesterase class I)